MYILDDADGDDDMDYEDGENHQSNRKRKD